ncbi:DNA-binding transcriptional regulator, AcrR family [Paractinoplanes atraurantiacus]|uniref:DNA-binding transcriptional regulator, AcrR family n=1 Tax=Paractinoplanes atraurantiacus TaxID=1036182 RepID=A0A285HGZ3_9ACTN|nr:TetR/AcrR family transcriptional regulator [Actinoplanes atraurantiacus]SNY34958.1 DNA-binding transcriptional regulator, AcrR family [Actinoplanes atraurantiacus]
MSRWRPGARERLEEAAIELFVEQGFAATTVPQITARAGLTTRTFFRHFADKREVLFGGDEIPGMATRMIEQAPAGDDPMTVILDGLRAVTAARFEGRRDELRVRREIVRSDPGLRERDLRKRDSLRLAISAGFQARGIDPLRAALLAETAVMLLFVSFDEWLDQPGDRTLITIIEDALTALRQAIA